MQAQAIARYVRVSPRKADRVLRLIRGQNVARAEEMLVFTTRPIAQQIRKVLKSAVANATQKDDALDPDTLRVKTAVASAGPSMKRIRYRAHHRADRFLKRMSHITIVVGDE